MRRMQRWFVNKLPDYIEGSEPNIDIDIVKKVISEHLKTIRNYQGTGSRDCDGGIYVGVGGVAYMFWKLSTSPIFHSERSSLLREAEYYIKPAFVHATRVNAAKNITDSVAFLLGNTGVYAINALIANSIGNDSLLDDSLKRYADAARYVIPVNFLPCGGDELLVGRAGYLSGVLALRKTLKLEVIPDDLIQKIFNSMLTSGRQYAAKHHSPSPLMYSYYNTEYLGAAHGLSGILQLMLSFPKCFENDQNATKDLKESVDYMLNLQTTNGNFPSAVGDTDGSEADELVHWCHGAPGVVYLMAKAYNTWKDDRYLQSCIKCGELVWKKGLLRKGPGTCHGVAGSGYVFLLLYRLTHDKKYLHRAYMFAEFMLTGEFKSGARTPDCPCSLYEGLAGTVCFLDDLLNPDMAHFPLFDIF